MTVETNEVAAWAASGAMALTGLTGAAPLGPPAGLVSRLHAVADHLRALTGGAVDVDPVALLAERAAIAGLRRGGQVSCGGGTRLLRAADGWLALSLARADDLDLVPAWLKLREPPTDLWGAVATGVGAERVSELDERGALLGLPVAALPNEPTGEAVVRTQVRKERASASRSDSLVVVDLGALWAAPLCSSFLAMAGTTVIKVESTTRPDGARRGPAAFFDLLNAGKQSVALDLSTREGAAALHQLIVGADVVIEGSRPRALEQLGIDAAQVLATGRPRVWASITGHGRQGAARERVAFGDDAAVAGGLVCWTRSTPVFCADAVADPATGLIAADAVLSALRDEGTWLLDVSMTGVAASLAGPTLPVPAGAAAAAPGARSIVGTGPRLGEHSAAVFAALSS